ncbi:MAG: metallophosphoesterase family protein [Nitrososphaerales archaeon]
MKLAIISDIHGFYSNLEAVLSQIESRQVDQLVCLGDVAELGPEPHRVVERLRKIKCPVVNGNEDEALLSANSPRNYPTSDDKIIHDIDKWGYGQLTKEDVEYMKGFKPTIEIPLGEGKNLVCCHGSPRSNTEKITSTLPDDQKLSEIVTKANNPFVIASGHSHLQMLRSYLGLTLWINPGSVGLPFLYDSTSDMKMDKAQFRSCGEYALLNVEDGKLGIELNQEPIEFETITRSVRESGMPHQEWLLALWNDYKKS